MILFDYDIDVEQLEDRNQCLRSFESINEQKTSIEQMKNKKSHLCLFCEAPQRHVRHCKAKRAVRSKSMQCRPRVPQCVLKFNFNTFKILSQRCNPVSLLYISFSSTMFSHLQFQSYFYYFLSIFQAFKSVFVHKQFLII